jgi:hypothetical protein
VRLDRRNRWRLKIEHEITRDLAAAFAEQLDRGGPAFLGSSQGHHHFAEFLDRFDDAVLDAR